MGLKGLSEKRKKQLMIALIAAFVLTAFCAVVYARYIRSSDKEENTLLPAATAPLTINETFEDNVKTNVSVSVGYTYYPVYVRAAVIINWKQAGEDDGLLYYEAPVRGVDYEIEFNDTDWEYNTKDGYYYYKYPVESEGTTKNLIERCAQLTTFTDEIKDREYTLNVEIIAQTVQAVGHTDDDQLMAVEDAWSWKADTGAGQ